MIVRVLAALVGLAIILPAIIFGGTPAVDVIVVIAGLIALDEYVRMAFAGDRWPSLLWLTIAAGGVYAASVYATAHVPSALALATMGSLAFVVFRSSLDLDVAAGRVARLVLGVGWLGALLAFIPRLHRLDEGLMWIFVVLVIPWGSDTGAYFTGRALGRHKMAQRISPKKTWEGFAGGVVTAMGALLVVRAVGNAVGEVSLGVLECLLLGAVLSPASVVGDLSVSVFKRAHEVKDTGSIMPGHGGLLDRIDSLLFVAPLLYIYASTLRG